MVAKVCPNLQDINYALNQQYFALWLPVGIHDSHYKRYGISQESNSLTRKQRYTCYKIVYWFLYYNPFDRLYRTMSMLAIISMVYISTLSHSYIYVTCRATKMKLSRETHEPTRRWQLCNMKGDNVKCQTHQSSNIQPALQRLHYRVVKQGKILGKRCYRRCDGKHELCQHTSNSLFESYQCTVARIHCNKHCRRHHHRHHRA